MPLGTMVGLDPGNIVLDADPAPPLKGHSPLQISAHVCCATWYKGRPRIVLHGDPARSSDSQKGNNPHP